MEYGNLEVERGFNSGGWFSETRTVTHRAPLEELASIGLEEHHTSICITENMIRLEHRLNLRTSHRGTYRR